MCCRDGWEARRKYPLADKARRWLNVSYRVAAAPAITSCSFNQAFAEVEQLWGSATGTPDGDRLDVLATLIEVYEEKRHLMDPPDPIGLD